MNTDQEEKNEEKNEKKLVDLEKKANTNPDNEDIGQEEKNINSPFDAEETLAFNQEEGNENNPANGKQSKTIKTILIVVLFLLPLVYIFYKTTNNSNSAPEQAASQTQQIDVATYENAANLDPSYQNLLNLSNAYINTGAAWKAIEPLNKAIALNPKSAVAYSNLGFAYTVLQQYTKGIEYGEKAVEIDSSFQLAKNNLKWAKDEQNKILSAIETMEKTSPDKRDNGFYVALGLLNLKLENYDKSIEIWNNILVTEPKNAIALINIGVAYMSKRQYNDAIKYFKKAVDNNLNDQLAKNNLAWALDEKIKEENLAKATGVQKTP